MAIWFTSDTHFAHAKVIEYCNRPFKNVDEMNDEMVRRWCSVVQPDDTVYHLGDFSFGFAENIEIFRKRLTGRIILIRGNHDKSVTRMEKALGIGNVHNNLELVLGGLKLFLSHKPTADVPAGTDYHLHGHVHEKYLRIGNAINVGVDQWDFTPVTLYQLLAAKEFDAFLSTTETMSINGEPNEI